MTLFPPEAPLYRALTGTRIGEVLDTMILSPSGWRGVFAASGNEEGGEGEISPAHGLIAAAGALVFAEYLRGEAPPENITLAAANSGGHAMRPKITETRSMFRAPPATPPIIVGTDTRPTGNAIASLMIRAFLASGREVHFAGVSAAPEIMAYSRTINAAFAYISASHNPIGHNGIKFGMDGGVLSGPEAETLITSLKEFLARDTSMEETVRLIESADEGEIRRVENESPAVKREALAAYREFSGLVIAGAAQSGGDGGDTSADKAVFDAIRAGLKKRPLGIAADFNGSARTLSIDGELFRSLGIAFSAMNAAPGEIAHAIIPEGESMEPCRDFLEKLHAADPSFILGYVPDCDGDRGNLVVWDDSTQSSGTAGRARILDAQEVFALSCAAELAQLVWTGGLQGKQAIAVNGPTSMRVDRIAAAFDVEVFRAEVGEANVVNLAHKLREEGYGVRILGEGSNGGNITHPSAVRDPLATLFALIKFLAIRGNGKNKPGLFDIWREHAGIAERGASSRCGASSRYGASGRCGATAPPGAASAKTGNMFTIADIIASLPRFYTTGVSTPEAKLQVSGRDHRSLKERYQRIFLEEWESKKGRFKERWGIGEWEARACIGIEEKRNLENFGDAETGGLKIVFKSRSQTEKNGTIQKGRETAFIWMRGSKTEPVFRIMADAENAELERKLIAWQRDMVQKADGGNAGE